MKCVPVKEDSKHLMIVHDFRSVELRKRIQANAPDATTYCGTLISVSPSVLFLRGIDGREHAHVLSADVRLTIDGKPCRIEELKAGKNVCVTQRTGGARVLTLINLLRDDEPVEDSPQPSSSGLQPSLK
jgi:hypothetical protein